MDPSGQIATQLVRWPYGFIHEFSNELAGLYLLCGFCILSWPFARPVVTKLGGFATGETDSIIPYMSASVLLLSLSAVLYLFA